MPDEIILQVSFGTEFFREERYFLVHSNFKPLVNFKLTVRDGLNVPYHTAGLTKDDLDDFIAYLQEVANNWKESHD